MASLISFVKSGVDMVSTYFSPRRDPKPEEHEEEVEADAGADAEEEPETSPIRNLAKELDKASEDTKEEEKAEVPVTRKRGRPSKKVATTEEEEEATSPKKQKSTATPKKTPGRRTKTPAKTPKSVKKEVVESESEEEEDNTEFVPTFTAGEKVEARFPGDGPEHYSWFNATISGVLTDKKSYEISWEDDNATDVVHHKYVRVRTPVNVEYSDLKTGQRILGFLDPGYWFSATITALEIKNKKERIFVTWDDISSRKKILALDEVRPVPNSEDKGKGGRKSKMLYFGHGLAGSGIVVSVVPDSHQKAKQMTIFI